MAEDLIILEIQKRLEKFKQQTYKDFELAGALANLPRLDTINLPQLQEAFYQSVLALDNLNALKNLLYRIDITELQIKQAAQQEPELPLQRVIAQLMIKRILQKIILKELYSK